MVVSKSNNSQNSSTAILQWSWTVEFINWNTCSLAWPRWWTLETLRWTSRKATAGEDDMYLVWSGRTVVPYYCLNKIVRMIRKETRRWAVRCCKSVCINQGSDQIWSCLFVVSGTAFWSLWYYPDGCLWICYDLMVFWFVNFGMKQPG